MLGEGSAAGMRERRSDAGEAKKEVKIVFDQLTLWTAISRVDELGEVVRTAVRRAWCRDLEDQVRVLTCLYRHSLSDSVSDSSFTTAAVSKYHKGS